MNPHTILVIKLRYLGDVLLATPALEALKTAYRSARNIVVVNRGTEAMLAGNPHVDEILPLERGSMVSQWRFLADLRRRRPDIAIDLTDADRSAFLTWTSGAPIRIGFNDEGRFRGRCYTTVVQGKPGLHRIERDLAALLALHIAATETAPKLWLTEDDEQKAGELLNRLGVRERQSFVVLQPGARYWFKAWPSERFAALADLLSAEYGCRVLLGGNTEEHALVQEIVSRSNSRPIGMAGLADVRTFASVLKRAMLFVGNDSGAMHIAAAVGTPLVALFGPSNPDEWGPRGGRAAILYKNLDCRACFHPTCDRGEQSCMRLISVEEVLSSIRRLMAGLV
ncbi:MAG TPA: putative lipopolysaccharide heptosyltransferase III [Nitrospira sp.]|nr:putative lipopolysaccharide heptosyltransferase III [Nitrospira sp.]